MVRSGQALSERLGHDFLLAPGFVAFFAPFGGEVDEGVDDVFREPDGDGDASFG